MVYGGLDGIVTTFAIVSGVAGASLGSGIILVLDLANLLADGFSMAAGAFLALKSELEYYIAACLSAAALFGLGAAKVLITERGWFRSGLEMLGVGGIGRRSRLSCGVPSPGAGRVVGRRLPQSTQGAYQLP